MDNPRASSGLPQFLIEAGLVSADAVKDVLDKHSNADERLAAIFVNSGVIPDAKLAQILSYQLCLPWVSLEHVRFSPKLLRMIPSDIALMFGVVPVHVRRRTTDGRVTLYIATDDPTNKLAEQACAKASGLPVRMMVATPSDISTALAEEYGQSGSGGQDSDTELVDTSPDGQAISTGEAPIPREGTAVPTPSPAAQPSPDPDVAAAAARMSSPDLSEYTNSPIPPHIAPPDIRSSATTSPVPRPAPPPPSAGIEVEPSPIPGLSAAAAKVNPRIVRAPEPDDEIEELDEVEEDSVPATPHAMPPSQSAASEDDSQPDPDSLFDDISWEDGPVGDNRDPLKGIAPLPPPPPPGAVAPPPPPVAARLGATQAAGAEAEEVEVEPADSVPPEKLEPTPAPHAASEEEEEEVVLVVGADDDFAYHCARALGNSPARIVRCTLMSAASKAKQLHPFAIIVPHEMYAFDRFAFNRLALEIGSPLVIWENEYTPQQFATLLSTARPKPPTPQG